MSFEGYLEFLGLEILEEEEPAPPCKTLKEILADGDCIEELPKEDYTVKRVAEDIENFKQFKTETEIISTYNTPKANIIVHQPIPGSMEYINGRTEFIEGMKLFYQNLVKNGFNWDKAVKQAREHEKLKKYKSV
jgi:hypothetical protein